jgi:hypothetical protein
VVVEAYVHGMSTRKVDDLVEAMGGAEVSKSDDSRICASLDETAGAFRTRTHRRTAGGEREILGLYVGDSVAAAFRMIFAQPTAEDVHAAWDKTRDELAARFPKLGPLMDDAKAEVLAFTSSPARALAQDLVDQPARAGEQGDQRRVRVVGTEDHLEAHYPAGSARSWGGSASANLRVRGGHRGAQPHRHR